MRLEIRRRGLKVTEELRNYLKERLRLALTRFGRHIDLVRVYLWDVNGPRGGPGKKCRMVVELPPRGRVIVAGADTVISRAVARTATRVGVAVQRHVKRRRARRRPPRRPARPVGTFAGSVHLAPGVLSGTGKSRGRLRVRRQKGGGCRKEFVMSKRVSRRNLARRTRCASGELIKGKLVDLEARMNELQALPADQTFRLATRVATLERGSAYVQVRDGS
jgi:putative sigma-54 modulation protein